MHLKRAHEILHSPQNIEVIYKNSPVWIESIQGDTQTAHIRVMDTTQTMSVGINDLIETGKEIQ